MNLPQHEDIDWPSEFTAEQRLAKSVRRLRQRIGEVEYAQEVRRANRAALQADQQFNSALFFECAYETKESKPNE